jgi:16S rRNA (cytosine967-C5)-methyltransferase
MTAVSPSRKVAFEILLTVERGRAHSDDLLRGKHVSELSAQDRHLATALVLGVLRWQIVLDEQVRAFLSRPNARLDTEIQIALRLGAFQLLHMDRIPAHAAIDESVELAKHAGHGFASRMVNAVLRKLAGSPRSQNLGASASDSVEAYPAWMVERWNRAYGSEGAQDICAWGQAEPTSSIRLADTRTDEELRQQGIVIAPGKLLNESRVVVSGDVSATAAFREGCVRFQDEGSQLVAEIAAFRAGKSLLDACAAPGGKALILAERNPQAKIVACEASAQRLTRLQERLASLGERVECRLGDAAEISDRAAYDLVLADVPCSGTGTLGRNPEIRHRLRSEDLPRQAERQIAILDAALRAVRSGGRVVYSTCSLEPEENEAVVEAVLREQPNVEIYPVRDCIAAMEAAGILVAGAGKKLATCATPEGSLRLMPGAFGTDGFFIALLARD